MKGKVHSILLGTLLTVGTCFAQSNPENSLKHSIAQIDSAFQQNNIAEFNRLMPIENIQDLYAEVATDTTKRKVSGKSRIIRIYKESAYVLLSGLVLYGNSGDETNFSTKYTGVYQFERVVDSWKIKGRVNIDRENQIKKHRLQIDITPAKNIVIKDTLTLTINDPFGFATKLNHQAKLENVLLNGTKTDFIFSGGLLWVDAKAKKNQQLIINYSIDVEQDEKNKNSGYFSETFGHLRNQYFWHPFFSFSSPNDRADFTLHCTIPKSYHLATSLPQKESIVGESRIIVAESETPTFGLSLYYDKDWEVTTFKKGQLDFVLYATKDFLPEKEILYAAFSKNYDSLQKYFGTPLSNYFGIVQDRSGGNGWKNRSNSIVVAGTKGSTLIFDKPIPRATFGHEVAHGWTSPTGPATNFLTEGWATYAESLLLFSAYGDSIVTQFYNSQKQNYLNGKFDGNISLWEDYSNNGVSYSKGSWLFYMLEFRLGKENLFIAMANFIRSGNQSIYSFINEMRKVAGYNMEPYLLPWLKGKAIPMLSIQQSGNKLMIRQEGDIFLFTIEIKLKLKNGAYVNKVIDITGKEQGLNITEGEIESYTVDPNNRLLFNIK